jgi:hypothetical protein
MAARKRATKLAPIHPGEVLLADFLEPLQLTQYRLAQDVSVPRVASMRLFMATALSQPIPRFGLRGISARPSAFG